MQVGIRLWFNEERLVSAAQGGTIPSLQLQDILAPTYKVLGPERRWKALLDPLDILDLGITAFFVRDSRVSLIGASPFRGSASSVLKG